MSARLALSCLCVLGLAACSSGTGITTGSVLGGDDTNANTAAVQHTSDPTSRALQVGTASARAAKCGYNFDGAALKSRYLAYEADQGAQVVDLARIETIYDTGFNGVAKAAAQDPNYCSTARTAAIKSDLTRHLAGDYSAPPKQVAKADEGFFGGFFESDSVESGSSFGSDDWWESQRDKIR